MGIASEIPCLLLQATILSFGRGPQPLAREAIGYRNAFLRGEKLKQAVLSTLQMVRLDSRSDTGDFRQSRITHYALLVGRTRRVQMQNVQAFQLLLQYKNGRNAYMKYMVFDKECS